MSAMTVPAFRTPDGLSLHQVQWIAPSPRARLLLVHGLGEHSGRYARLAGELNSTPSAFRSARSITAAMDAPKDVAV
ncbi:alpha/beta hydrolase [Pseudoxanthomonas sp.]|uniref:serine aminopeptidase domain-containing protein n=1 Tax=Pseudoxanthomonas sp. TaxID=1871049 RepID=UPI002616E6ED|nr:alpha/beta hydrolase [Pseudoxanthomonas sp.]WDS35822.1 MAG: hypothetical protein O8I58_16110 [Pseudoxanthomonas sp.]